MLNLLVISKKRCIFAFSTIHLSCYYTMEKRYLYDYPRPMVATDCVVFGFDGSGLKVLLVRRGGEPYADYWALPGGFMQMNETAEECVKRELLEETSIEPLHIEQFHTFTAVKRDSRDRVLSIAFFALSNLKEVEGVDDVKEARWFDLNDIPDLAFDHNEIIALASKSLRERIAFEPIGFEMMPDTFSMTYLQRLYEAILGIKFDRRNFYRKILTLGILERADGKQSVWLSKMKGEYNPADYPEGHTEKKKGAPSRIPYLYKFNREKYDLLKKKGNGFRLEF